MRKLIHAVAAAISNAACELDHFKNALPALVQPFFTFVVEEMHDLAELLLGQGRHALHAPDEEIEVRK